MSAALELLHTSLAETLPRLRRFARSLTRNVHDADDLVQVTVERALQRHTQWRSPTGGVDDLAASISSLRGWMFGIMKNAWTDERRAHGREQQVLAPEQAGTQIGNTDSEQLQERLSIEAAMRQLPDEQRLAVSLVLIEGLSYKEAATILEIPQGTLTSRLARGRDALALLLADAGGAR